MNWTSVSWTSARRAASEVEDVPTDTGEVMAACDDEDDDVGGAAAAAVAWADAESIGIGAGAARLSVSCEWVTILPDETVLSTLGDSGLLHAPLPPPPIYPSAMPINPLTPASRACSSD